MTQKSWEMTETLAYGYSSESTQWDLSNEYQHDRVLMVYKNLCMLVFLTKVASNAGLINVEYESQAPSIYHRIGQPSVCQCKSFTLQYLHLDIKTHTGPRPINTVKIAINLAF